MVSVTHVRRASRATPRCAAGNKVLSLLKNARCHSPFTRASSAGLTGKRVIGCLRSEATSFMTPRQAEQRSEPEGPRSRVPGGIAKGGWASSPPWLAVKAKNCFNNSTIPEKCKTLYAISPGWRSPQAQGARIHLWLYPPYRIAERNADCELCWRETTKKANRLPGWPFCLRIKIRADAG